MKKFLLLIAAVAALSLTSCVGNTDYKAKGAEMAKQLDELCNKQDADSALLLDKSIKDEEHAIVAMGDSAAISDFRAAIKESRDRNAPYIAASKVKKGANKDDVIKDLEDMALESNLSMDAMASSINAVLKADAEMKKDAPKE